MDKSDKNNCLSAETLQNEAQFEVGLAQAQFDNDSEWPDELQFDKGDYLRVFQQQPGQDGQDGWWLVADKTGKSGIAPANRLKMMHRFRPPENRVITPQRLGDVFVYGDNTSLLDDAAFRATLHAFRSNSPAPLNSLTLLHDSEHPFGSSSCTSSRASSIVRDVPIKIEGTRKSPPPPPQRKYFHSFNANANGAVSSGSEDTSRSEPLYNTPLRSQYNGTSLNGLMYKKPQSVVSTTRGWRSHKTPLADLQSSPEIQRDSISSSVSASPHEESERSSSMSEADSSRSSYLDDSTYNTPSGTSRVIPALPPRSVQILADRSWPSTSRHDVSKAKGDEKAATALLNVLEDLYDSPRSNSASLKTPMSYKQLREHIGKESYTLPPLSVPSRPPIPPGLLPQTPSSSSFYDAPKLRQETATPEQLPANLERLSVSSIDSKDSDFQALLLNASEVHLSPAPALAELTHRLQDLQSSIALLSSFSAKKNWRRRIILAQTLSDMRVAVNQVSKNLEIFLDFTSGALLNATRSDLCKAANSNIAKRLAHLMRPLKDAQEMLERKKQDLSRSGWTVTSLARDEHSSTSNDALDQLIAVAQQVPEDCRQVVSFLQGNASLIFCPSHLSASSGSSGPVSSSEDEATNNNHTYTNGNTMNNNGRIIEEDELDSVMSNASSQRSLLDDYDFVDNIASNSQMEHRLSRDTITNESVNDREESTTPTAEFASNSNLTANNNTTNGHNSTEPSYDCEDMEMVKFYAPQVDAHMQYVSSAIEDFLTAIEGNRPPREFVQKSKLVILGAHKLVYIGDSIVQCLHNIELGDQLRVVTDRLCSQLKFCVSNTKTAATHYPSVSSVQAMVDSMVAVSHAANKLKLLMRKLANTSAA